ncbi:LD-carboxypeptidase [Erythrobacter sp. QSSC1-22B]|uniref:LD-carboxypeptidase n=1 Tax=Erythrobacter sp. QSSC1-22B TaxID=1860125 RepID=UPI0008054AC2|nr:LD-carboxypeptidase [Erythrobacter sp. QSSC1-22B]OBX18449.1 LD-carboxypeptidase [Erythrobacter sp. QSSC1-22B]
MKRVAICAPATPLKRKLAQRVAELAVKDYPQLELSFHEQCFASEGHFAGSDAVRLAALLECANDPGFDAVWFAKGGYGSNRIARAALAGMNQHAARKSYLGYSDCGTMLGALYRAGIGQPVHAPMPVDLKREGGEAAVRRSLDWLAGDPSGQEESVGGKPAVAFNLMTLAMLVGTEFMPPLAGHVVMIEEVAEHIYAIDRMMFHVTQHLDGVAGIRLGEVTRVPENDRPFGSDGVAIVEDWCSRSDIPYLGRAQIGHNAHNRIVPFGLVEAPHAA